MGRATPTAKRFSPVCVMWPPELCGVQRATLLFWPFTPGETRLVPMSPALTSALGVYVAQCAKEHPAKPDGALFLTRTATPVARHTAENIFSRLRVHAGVLRRDGGRYQPRLHDLRHAFAVHRLVSWYRQGADVQRLLPQLATYLGHIHIAATQRYLTMTPELLHEAGQRFERYARGGTV